MLDILDCFGAGGSDTKHNQIKEIVMTRVTYPIYHKDIGEVSIKPNESRFFVLGIPRQFLSKHNTLTWAEEPRK